MLIYLNFIYGMTNVKMLEKCYYFRKKSEIEMDTTSNSDLVQNT